MGYTPAVKMTEETHCDSGFVGRLSLGSADNSKGFGVCQNGTHYIIAGVKRDCVDNLYRFSRLQASSDKFHGTAKDAAGKCSIGEAKVRIYNGLCPMHLSGGHNAKVLSEIDMKFDGTPENFDILVELIAKQTISQIKNIFDADPELQEVVVDVEI